MKRILLVVAALLALAAVLFWLAAKWVFCSRLEHRALAVKRNEFRRGELLRAVVREDRLGILFVVSLSGK